MLNLKNLLKKKALLTPLALLLSFVLAFGGLTSTIVMATANGIEGDPGEQSPVMENIGVRVEDTQGANEPGGKLAGYDNVGLHDETEAPAVEIDYESGEITDEEVDDESGDEADDKDVDMQAAGLTIAPVLAAAVQLTSDDVKFTFDSNGKINGVSTQVDGYNVSWQGDAGGGGVVLWECVLEGMDPATSMGMIDVSAQMEIDLFSQLGFKGGAINGFDIYFREYIPSKAGTGPELPVTDGARNVDSGTYFELVISVSLEDLAFYDNGKIRIPLPDYIDKDDIIVTSSVLNKSDVIGNTLELTLIDNIEGRGSVYDTNVLFKYKNGVTPNGYVGDFKVSLEIDAKANRNTDGPYRPLSKDNGEKVRAHASEQWTVSKAYAPGDVSESEDAYTVKYSVTISSDKTGKAAEPGARLYIDSFTLSDMLKQTVTGDDHGSSKWEVTDITGPSGISVAQKPAANVTDYFDIVNGGGMLTNAATFTVTVRYPKDEYTTDYENKDNNNTQSTVNNSVKLTFTQPSLSAAQSQTSEAEVDYRLGIVGGRPSAALVITKYISINNGAATPLTTKYQELYGKVKFEVNNQIKQVDSNGKVTFTGLPDGTYTIREITDDLAQGFGVGVYTGTASVTGAGVLTVSRADALAQQTFNVTCTNVSPAGTFASLKVQKVGEQAGGGKTNLAGVGFALYASEADFINAPNSPLREGITDGQGALTFEGLKAGAAYWLKEKALPEGYGVDASNDYYTNGKAVTISGAVNNVVTLTVINKSTRSNVRVYKQFIGPDGKVANLSGASTLPKFEIRDSSNRLVSAITPGIVSSSGSVSGTPSVVLLDAGTYTLHETTMSGLPYNLPENPIATFTISSSPNAYTIVPLSGGNGSLMAGDVSTQPFLNYSTKGQATIIKKMAVDANGSLATDISGTVIKFDISKNDGVAFSSGIIQSGISLTIGNDGTGRVTVDLDAGTYYIKETQGHAGYTLDTTVRSVTVSAPTPGSAVEAGKIEFVNNKLGTIKITKSDVNDEDKKLEGVIFSLFVKSGMNYIEYKVNNKQVTATTDSEGIATFDNLPVGIYAVKEIKAASGYLLPAVTYVKDEISVELYKTTGIELTNIPESSIRLIKKDKINDSVLSGAQFKLEKRNGSNWTDISGKLSGSGRTSSDGVITSTGLDEGTYRITETAAPGGYFANDIAVTFTVDSSGNVTFDGTGLPADYVDLPNAYIGAAVSGGQSITVYNLQAVSLTVNKYGDSVFLPGTYNVPLKDAKFELFFKNGDKVNVSGQGGMYTVDATGKAVMATAENGSIVINNLDPTYEYVLKEVEAPAGYSIKSGNDNIAVTFIDGNGDVLSSVTKSVENDLVIVKVRVIKEGFLDENGNRSMDGTESINGSETWDLFNAQFALVSDYTVAAALAKLAQDNRDKTRDEITALADAYLSSHTDVWVGGRYLYTGTEDTVRRNTALSDWFARPDDAKVYLVEILPPVDGGFELPENNIFTVDLSNVVNRSVINQQVADPYTAGNGGKNINHVQIQIEKLGQVKNHNGQVSDVHLNGAKFEVYANDSRGGADNWVLLETITSGSDGAGAASSPRAGFALTRAIEFGENLYSSFDGNTGKYTLNILIKEIYTPDGYVFSNPAQWTLKIVSDPNFDGLIVNNELTGNNAVVNPMGSEGYFEIVKRYSDGKSAGEVSFYVFTDSSRTKPANIPGAQTAANGYTVIKSGVKYGPILSSGTTSMRLYLTEIPESVPDGYNAVAPFAITVNASHSANSWLKSTVTNRTYTKVNIRKTTTTGGGSTISLKDGNYAVFEIRDSEGVVVESGLTQQGGAFSVSTTVMLKDGVYTIRETDFMHPSYYMSKNAEGDAASSTIVEFTVAQGSVASSRVSWNNGSTWSTWSSIPTTGTLNFPNPTLGTVNINKKLQNYSETSLPSIVPAGKGIEFVLYTSEDGDEIAKNPVTGAELKGTTNINGAATITGVPAGTFWIEETEAPEGFRKPDGRVSVTVSVGSNGNLATVSSTITNKTNDGALRIVKQNLSGVPIENEVVFEISADGKPTETVSVVRGSHMVRLEAGIYTVTEKTPPAGYGLPAASNMSQTVEIKPQDNPGEVNEQNVVTFKDPLLAVFSLYKYDKNDANNGLGGAKFTMYSVAADASESEILSVTTDHDGKFTLNQAHGLEVGSYKLVETEQPFGYELGVGEEPWETTFDVVRDDADENNPVYKIVPQDASLWDFGETVPVVNVPNERTGVWFEIDKVGSENSDVQLGGALYNIYLLDAANNRINAIPYRLESIVDDVASILLPLANSYEIIEVRAPNGYSLDVDGSMTWVRSLQGAEYEKAVEIASGSGTYPGVVITAPVVSRSAIVQVRFLNANIKDPTPEIPLEKRFEDKTLNLYADDVDSRTATFYISNIYGGTNEQPLQDFTVEDSQISFFSDKAGITPALPGSEKAYSIIGATEVERADGITASDYTAQIVLVDDDGDGKNEALRVFYGDVPEYFMPKDLRVVVAFDKREINAQTDEVLNITNSAVESFTYRGESGLLSFTATASAMILLEAIQPPIPPVSLTKDLQVGRFGISPGSEQSFRLVVTNHDNETPMPDPVIIDILGDYLSYDNISNWSTPVIGANSNLTLTGAGPVAFTVDGKSAVRWEFKGELAPGESIAIEYNAFIDAAVPMKTPLENHAFLSSTRKGYQTKAWTYGTLFSSHDNANQPMQLRDELDSWVYVGAYYLEATETFALTNGNSYGLSKGIRRPGESAYGRGVLLIEPSARIEYQVVLNAGGSTIVGASIADIIPWPNDTMTLSSNVRGTPWADSYLSVDAGSVKIKLHTEDGDETVLNAGSDYSVYYLTNPNVKSWNGTFGGWSSEGAQRNYGVGVLLDGSIQINRGDRLEMEFSATADDITDINETDFGRTRIGYNTAASAVPGATTTETNRVGVRFEPNPVVFGKIIWEDFNSSGIQPSNPVSILGASATLQERINGVWTDIADKNGFTTIRNETDTGLYSFKVAPHTIVDPHEYRVKYTLPEGYVYSEPYSGSARTDDSDAIADADSEQVAYSASFRISTTGDITYTSGGISGQVVPGEATSDGYRNMSVDAGAFKPSEIGNYVWIDKNRDGLQNDTMSPADIEVVKGAVVTLLNDNGQEVASAAISDITDPVSGNYIFRDLRPGTYYVHIDISGMDDRYRFTDTDMDPDHEIDSRKLYKGIGGVEIDKFARSGFTEKIIINSGESVLNIDFGLQIARTIVGDYVWHEALSINGIQDDGDMTDVGIEGVEVRLYTLEDDGTGNGTQHWIPARTHEGEALVTRTDNTGYYEFVDVPFGSYRAYFDLSTNAEGKEYRFTEYVSKSSTVDKNGIIGSLPGGSFANTNQQGYGEVFVLNGSSKTIVNDEGELLYAYLDADVGAYLPVAIGDYLWHDSTRRGDQTVVSNAGINGAVVNLYEFIGDIGDTASVANTDNYVLHDTTVTISNPDNGDDGYYIFDGLDPGAYAVEFEMPAGYNRFTTRYAQNVDAEYDSNVNVNGVLAGFSDPVDLTLSGAGDMTIDAGVYLHRPGDPEPEATPTPYVTPGSTSAVVSTATPNVTLTAMPTATASFVMLTEDDTPAGVQPLQQQVAQPTRRVLALPDDEIPYGAITPPANRFVDILEDETPYGMVKTGEVITDVCLYLLVGLLLILAGLTIILAEHKRKQYKE